MSPRRFRHSLGHIIQYACHGEAELGASILPILPRVHSWSKLPSTQKRPDLLASSREWRPRSWMQQPARSYELGDSQADDRAPIGSWMLPGWEATWVAAWQI